MNYDPWDSFLPTLVALKLAGVLSWSWIGVLAFWILWVAANTAIRALVSVISDRLKKG